MQITSPEQSRLRAKLVVLAGLDMHLVDWATQVAADTNPKWHRHGFLWRKKTRRARLEDVIAYIEQHRKPDWLQVVQQHLKVA